MRILGFSKKWNKLTNQQFTTFRFQRRDKDWEIGEQVQVVYKPRSKEREILGIAQIIAKDFCNIRELSQTDAIQDGFLDREDMMKWLDKVYKGRIYEEPMNKLTLKWVIILGDRIE
mgnify:FL=1